MDKRLSKLAAVAIVLSACAFDGETEEGQLGKADSLDGEEVECAPTFDDQPPIDEGLVNGAECRGACGASCPVDPDPDDDVVEGCTEVTRHSCLDYADGAGEPRHKVCRYTEMSCGSHQGCRTHDACYDRCALVQGWRGSLCRRGCDLDCTSRYDVATCNSWRRGNGPFDSILKFSQLERCDDEPGTCVDAGFDEYE